MGNKKPYNKDVKSSRRTKKVKKDNLENTIKIRIDNDRLNDTESLDTSFLEGRVNTNTKSKLLSDSKKKSLDIFGPLKTIFTIIVVLLFILGIANIFNSIDDDSFKKTVPEDEVKKVNIDYNYLFIGGFHTNKINFDEYDFHYIKSADDKYNISNFIDSMKEKVYDYNPSHVFIEIGINDLDNDGNSEFSKDLIKLINLIKDNRPDASIYVESIYPINKDVEDYDDDIIEDYIDNKMIIDVNKKIRKICNDNNVNYLDIYSVLSDDSSSNLKEEYTDNGIYLNDKGYNEVKKVIKKVLGR